MTPTVSHSNDPERLTAEINAALALLTPTPKRWTPFIVGTTLGGVGTYSIQKGWYTKVGQQVTAWGTLRWSAHTGTGNMRIAGLPCPAMRDHDTLFRAYGSLVAETLTFTQQLVLTLVAGESVMQLQSMTTGASAAETALDTAATVAFTITYLTDERG